VLVLMGLLIVLPLVGAFALVRWASSACGRKGGLFRLLGITIAFIIGGICILYGYGLTFIGLPLVGNKIIVSILGVIYMLSGCLIIVVGIWNALKAGKNVQLVDEQALSSINTVLCGHNWMNMFCIACRHYYTDNSFCCCHIPDLSRNIVNKAISEGDNSFIYGNSLRLLSQTRSLKILPCFELSKNKSRYSTQRLLPEEEVKLNALYEIDVYPLIGGSEAPLSTTEDKLRAFSIAVNALEKAVVQEPGEFLWHFKLGSSYFLLGRFADAVTANSHALVLHPEDPRVEYNMATYLRAMTRAAYCGTAFRDKVENIRSMQRANGYDWSTYQDMLPFEPDTAENELRKLNITWQYAVVEAVRHFQRAIELGLPSSEVADIKAIIKAISAEFSEFDIVIK